MRIDSLQINFKSILEHGQVSKAKAATGMTFFGIKLFGMGSFHGIP